MGLVELPELLERERELEAVASALSGVDEGMGRFLAFDGEPGIGKSALLREVIARAGARHVRVLSARATPIEQNVPFGVALQLFAPVLEDASEAERERLLAGPAGLAQSLLSGGEAEGAGSLQGLRWLVTRLARPRRLAIAVDDVQWCDAPSLRLLHALAPGIEELPLLVAVTHRPDAGADLERLAAGLAALPGVLTLRPARLSSAASATVVRGVMERAEPGFCEACAQASGGNPYLLGELLSSLRDAGHAGLAADAQTVAVVVPHTVAATALVRIARLGDRALHLAQAVAVLGDGAPLGLAAALAAQAAGEDGDTPHAVAAETADALAAIGVLAPGLPLRFAHPLLAAAVHSDMPAVARQLAHARAALALARTGAPATAVAAHILLGPRPFDEGERVALLTAGQEALARDDPLAAERLLAPLLEQPLSAEAHRAAETGLALAEAAAGRSTALQRLQRAVLDERDPAARARPLRAMCRLHFARGELKAAAACAREAHAVVGADHPLADTLLAERFAISAFQPEAVEPDVVRLRMQMLERALAGELPEHPATLAHFVTFNAIRGRPAAVVAKLWDAAFDPAARVAPEWDGLTLVFLASAAVYIEDAPRGERAIAEVERLAIARGAALVWSQARHWRGELRLRQGRLDEAVADAHDALDLAHDGWSFVASRTAGLLVRGHVARGDLPAARRAAHAVTDAEARETMFFGLFGQAALGELLLAEGRPGEALAALVAAGEGLAGRNISNAAILPWRPQAVMAAMALGDHGRAAALAADELEEAHRIGLPGRIGAALRAQALATVDVDQRAALLVEAIAALEPAIDRLELAGALADLGALHARRGRIDDAREPLVRAGELAQQCGAQPLAARAQAALAAIGVRARNAADRDQLTPSERQIAQLAAEGMTNRQIAGRLVLTPKTVEWHLTRAYAKLGISSAAGSSRRSAAPPAEPPRRHRAVTAAGRHRRRAAVSAASIR